MPSSDKWPSETKMDGSDAHSTRLASRRRKKVSGAKPVRARSVRISSRRKTKTRRRPDIQTTCPKRLGALGQNDHWMVERGSGA